MARQDDHSFGETASWLVGAAKRNPEAVLFLAAGAALLLRNGSSAFGHASGPEHEDFANEQQRRWPETEKHEPSAMESAADYASDAAGQVYETASSYASAASRYARKSGRVISRQASRRGGQAQSVAVHVWREQPLAVAAVGLAAGAALAALIPPTRVEERAFNPAADVLSDAAGRTVESVKEAAGHVAERMQQDATGMAAAGLKTIARDAAETFANSMSGKNDKTGSSVSGGSTNERS